MDSATTLHIDDTERMWLLANIASHGATNMMTRFSMYIQLLMTFCYLVERQS